MTDWRDIAGIKCIECGKPASHFDHDGLALCCQCHGGHFTAEEIKQAHEAVLKERRIANKYED
jgi:uncharacterized Zn finger protein (UPF0148 family)